MEAEFFGAEAGAYTGAVRARTGRFELASGGTLFLDEIGELPPAGQVKLLRVLETGAFEPLGSSQTRFARVRILSATNADLPALIRTDRFRENLYYRLNAIQIKMSALSERIEDIVPLAQHFLGSAHELSEEAIAALTGHAWPGNVRELRKAIERARRLADAHQRVAYANLAARHLLAEGRSLTGRDFRALLAHAPEALRTAVASLTDSLFSAEIAGIEETFHLSQRAFRLQGRPYQLYLLKTLTRELSRQEVAVWKKLIRVFSHEINSLGPIDSVAQSGVQLACRGDLEGVKTAFGVIAERSAHLHQFLSGYATFARLPAPRPEIVAWQELVTLVPAGSCRIVAPLPVEPGWFDRAQIAQALINVLDNAHEAGGPAEAIELAVTLVGGEQRIEVRDRGPGMSEAVLRQALLPFYSTKRQGTGLGLALTREIAEGHGGRVRLANREGGGLSVTLLLPAGPATKGMV